MRKLGATVSCQFEGKQYLCRKRKSATFGAVAAGLQFISDQVFDGLSFADEAQLVAANERFGGQRA